MRTVGAYEAKTHLPRLLEEVAHGEIITITRRGLPVARLVPADGENGGARRREAVEAMLEFGRKHNVKLPEGMTIREMIEEGRRY